MDELHWGWWVTLAVGGIFLVLILTAYAAKPIKWLGRGVMYTGIGAIALFLVNFVTEQWGFHLPINPVTAFITGALGIPGFVCLVFVKVWIIGL